MPYSTVCKIKWEAYQTVISTSSKCTNLTHAKNKLLILYRQDSNTYKLIRLTFSSKDAEKKLYP
jgi:hypothetical protein